MFHSPVLNTVTSRQIKIEVRLENNIGLVLDVHGSVHHNTNRIEITNKCDRVVEFIVPMFLNP